MNSYTNHWINKMVILASILSMLLLTSCRATNLSNGAVSSVEHLSNIQPNVAVTSAIRTIDFGKVRYHNFPNHDDGPRRITLEPGQAAPAFVDYGDVTEDGKDEAFVVFPNPTHGTAIPYYVYIFTVEDGRLKTLWDFEAGDRGDGGVRRIYAEAGKLVVELYSENKIIGRLYEKEGPTSRPTKFTRVKYRFRGNEFHMISKPEIEPNPSEESSVLMTP